MLVHGLYVAERSQQGFLVADVFQRGEFIKCELQGSRPPRKKSKKITTAEDKTSMTCLL